MKEYKTFVESIVGSTTLQEQVEILKRCELVSKRKHGKQFDVLEIGTFRGCTSAAIWTNFPNALIVTVDLPSGAIPILHDNPDERPYYSEKHSAITPEMGIEKLYCDSALLDFGMFDLIFVDGCHSYDYMLCDTLTALHSIGDDGIIIWHDYGECYIDTVMKVIDKLRETYPITLIPDTKLAVLDMAVVSR